MSIWSIGVDARGPSESAPGGRARSRQSSCAALHATSAFRPCCPPRQRRHRDRAGRVGAGMQHIAVRMIEGDSCRAPGSPLARQAGVATAADRMQGRAEKSQSRHRSSPVVGPSAYMRVVMRARVRIWALHSRRPAAIIGDHGSAAQRPLSTAAVWSKQRRDLRRPSAGRETPRRRQSAAGMRAPSCLPARLPCRAR